jgi:hypothetical protein
MGALVLMDHAILCSITHVTLINEAQLYAYVKLSVVEVIGHLLCCDEGETNTPASVPVSRMQAQ